MATWKEPKTNYTVENQVTPDIFNTLGENENYLKETKITISQVEDGPVTSTEASTRENITSGETVKGIVGKIRKWFSDLKALAFMDTIGSAQIDSQAITQGKIASNAVTYGKLASNAVVTAKIADEAVTEPKIGVSAVTNSRLADGAVTESKIGDRAVTNAKINSVAASKVTGLSTVATTGKYSDLLEIPEDVDFSPYMKKADMLNYLYPIGSIRLSTSSTNPSTYLGGTWSLWGSGRVPVGVDTAQTEFATVEKTGGEKTHQLTMAEMPMHAHQVRNSYGVNAAQTNVIAYSNTVTGMRDYTNISQTSLAGESAYHNNLQPYITCYMWKRTA